MRRTAIANGIDCQTAHIISLSSHILSRSVIILVHQVRIKGGGKCYWVLKILNYFLIRLILLITKYPGFAAVAVRIFILYTESQITGYNMHGEEDPIYPGAGLGSSNDGIYNVSETCRELRGNIICISQRWMWSRTKQAFDNVPAWLLFKQHLATLIHTSGECMPWPRLDIVT